MGFYYNALNGFKPMEDEVSWAPFSEARDIAWRARNLLRGRDNKQVSWLASDLHAWIDAYFDQEKESSVQMLKDENRFDLLESDDKGNHWEIKTEAHNEFDIRTSDNMSPLDAAKEVFETMDIFHDQEIPEAKDYEYLAAMALAMIGSYIDSLENTFNIRKMKSEKRQDKNYQPHEVSRFGSQLIEAMEVVTYAESVKAIARMEETRRLAVDKSKKADVSKVEAQVKAQLAAIQKADSEKRRKWGQQGKEKSLAQRDKARNAVLAQWEQDKSLQKKSNAKAAAVLWAWLEEQRYKEDLQEFSPDTIAQWISHHKKIPQQSS